MSVKAHSDYISKPIRGVNSITDLIEEKHYWSIEDRYKRNGCREKVFIGSSPSRKRGLNNLLIRDGNPKIRHHDCG